VVSSAAGPVSTESSLYACLLSDISWFLPPSVKNPVGGGRLVHSKGPRTALSFTELKTDVPYFCEHRVFSPSCLSRTFENPSQSSCLPCFFSAAGPSYVGRGVDRRSSCFCPRNGGGRAVGWGARHWTANMGRQPRIFAMDSCQRYLHQRHRECILIVCKMQRVMNHATHPPAAIMAPKASTIIPFRPRPQQ
jgi:hypothetical protein